MSRLWLYSQASYIQSRSRWNQLNAVFSLTFCLQLHQWLHNLQGAFASSGIPFSPEPSTHPEQMVEPRRSILQTKRLQWRKKDETNPFWRFWADRNQLAEAPETGNIRKSWRESQSFSKNLWFPVKIRWRTLTRNTVLIFTSRSFTPKYSRNT